MWEAAVTAVAFALFNLIFIPSILSMWMRRKELLLKARGPRLCCLSGVAHVVFADMIFIQELLIQYYNIIVPQSVMLWTGSLRVPFIVVPVILRARRLLIIIGPESAERERQLSSLDVRTQMKFFLVPFVIVNLVSALAEVWKDKEWWRSDLNYMGQPCFFSFPVSVLSLRMVYKEAISLLLARDKLELGSELVRGSVIASLSIIPYFGLVVLHDLGIIHVTTRIQFFAVAGIALMLTDAFIVSRRHWAYPQHRSVQMEIDEENTIQYRRWPDSLALIADLVMDPIFADYVLKHLCYDSYRFIVDAHNYAKICNDPKTTVKAQYRLFKDIVKRHIEAGSPLEINISHSTREPILACMREFAYINLPFDERLQMFHACIKETSRILDTNL